MIFIYEKSKITDGKLVDSVADYFRKNYEGSVEICACKDEREVLSIDLLKNPADIVVTLNLMGFSCCTLTDGLFYNLVNSKFVNLLLRENLPSEKYLSKQLSISMFFYCVGRGYYEYLLKEYSEIPYLRELEGGEALENDKNAENNNVGCIISAIEEVMRECCL